MNKSLRHLEGKQVLVIGLGISGQSAVRFLLKRGAQVTGVDCNRSLIETDLHIRSLIAEGARIIHEDTPCDLHPFDFIVVSPGIPLMQPHYKAALEQHKRVLGEAGLAGREIDKKCIGITGTNGKTTVTLLTTHILNEAGKKAVAAGNVGTALTAILDDPLNLSTDIFVVELSSFQLETMTSAFLDCAVILNITPDHLDRYPSMSAYAQTKSQIQLIIKENGKLFVESACAKKFSSLFAFNQKTHPYGYADEPIHTDTQKIYHTNRTPITLPSLYAGKPSHDLENIMAAYALCSEMNVSSEEFLKGLKTFTKPPHRLEFVGSKFGISYYDDSKGTNTDAVARAVETLNGPIILIAGGVDKGAPYSPWIRIFGNKVKRVFAIGQAAEKIQNQIGEAIPVELCTGLEEAVLSASKAANSGDTILLSPGCSSYDMFKDYIHRGNEFKRIVNSLSGEVQ